MGNSPCVLARHHTIPQLFSMYRLKLCMKFNTRQYRPRLHNSTRLLSCCMSFPTGSTKQLSEYAQRQISEGVIDLAAGQPGPSLLPLQHIAVAAADRLTGPKADPFILQYGPEQGNASFRSCLAAFLTAETGHSVDPADLLITAGVSHGLDLVCRHLASPGDFILVDSPTYFLAGSILRQAGLRLIYVPAGPDGVDVNALQQRLESPDTPRPRLYYTIPVYNNPTGVTMSLQKRMQLLQLAHQHDFHVVADEVYQLLSFPDSPTPPPPMRAVERSMFSQGLLPNLHPTLAEPLQDIQPTQVLAGSIGSMCGATTSTHPGSRVVSLGSFSKIMAPGLRCGWVEAAPAVLSCLRRDGVLGSGGAIAPLASGIAHSCLELGLLQQHMHGIIRPTLQRNCEALCDVLKQELPDGCHFNRPEGGYFVWLQVPDEVCSEGLLQIAADRFKVKFTPGRVCDGQAHMLRLSFAFYQEQELKDGAMRIASAIQHVLQARDGSSDDDHA